MVTTDVPVLRRAAVDCLARREHSYYELTQKLLSKFPDAEPALVDVALSRLRAEQLQSDERFAEAYVRYRKSRGFAYLYIKSDLVQRKVPLPIINAYLYEDDAEWSLIAQTLVERKTTQGVKLEFGSKLHRRLARFLESRGFSQLETRRVLAQKLG
ncbi:MAG: regulatory protein RecX [Gammaproteobacteria bacterium]|nr:regulatory protein RecX [Gammaproteobacteria bacterium]